MAQFDVHRLATGEVLVDCQSNFLSHYNTRLMVPLVPVDAALPIMKRLNPRFSIDGEDRVMMTEFAAAVPVRELGAPISSLATHDLTIKAALDVLISGY